MQFRSRLDCATITTPCGDDTHTVTINLDGTITMPHDQDADDVMFALGAPHHACQRILNAYDAALARDAALTGTHDIPYTNSTRTPGVFISPHACDECRTQRANGTIIGRSHNIKHYTTPQHLAATYNANPDTIQRFTHWINRRIPNPHRLPDTPRTTPAVMRYYPHTRNTIEARELRRLTITTPYLTSITQLLPPTSSAPDIHHAAITARNNGIRTEWLHHITTHTRPTALTHARETHPTAHHFLHTLSKARNADPTEVTRLLNAGITAHLYTYAKYRAPIDAILTVYRATHGTRTLADYLNNGTSIPDALQHAQHANPESR